MKASSIGVASLIAFSIGCSSQSILVNDYVAHDKRTRVPAEIPAFKVTNLDGYESPKHPGKILVVPPTGNMFSITTGGNGTQWVAMLPTIEPIYRKVAIETLLARGRRDCELGAATPLPEMVSIEFAYHCAS